MLILRTCLESLQKPKIVGRIRSKYTCTYRSFSLVFRFSLRNSRQALKILALPVIFLFFVDCNQHSQDSLKSKTNSTSTSLPLSLTQQQKLVSIQAEAMGTKIVLTAYTNEKIGESEMERHLQKALKRMRNLEDKMSTWKNNSEISLVNQNAGLRSIKISEETFQVLEKSIWIGKLSEGTFDITFEALHPLWKFDHDLDGSIPTEEQVNLAKKNVDFRELEISKTNRTAFLKRKGMKINLGGIAKGYILDEAATVLNQAGIQHFLVQAGGDLFISGNKPDGSLFKVGIRDPRGKSKEDYFAKIEVKNHAFSTAGDYERSFIKDGKRYHHIIDPRTGYPSVLSRSVTVWARNAFLADALDDAVFLLGPEKGLKLLETLDDCGAVIVDSNNKVWISENLKDKVEVLNQPTNGI